MGVRGSANVSEPMGRVRLAALFVLACASHARAQERIAPRAIELPSIVRPEGIEGEHIEVIVLVEADGSAAIDSCDHAEAICAELASLLAEARFEPARVDSNAVRARIRVAFSIVDPVFIELEPAQAPPN